MSDWKPKRFWKEAQVVGEGDTYSVSLDGRPVRTPAKAALLLPTRAMAEAIAAEWDAQEGEVNPVTMPFTRSANAAIDKVRHQHGEVAEMLAAYGDSDLLCYRADSPSELVARQARDWDPALEWAADVLGARLALRSGVIHAPQEPETLSSLSARIHRMTDFQLAAFHDLVSLSGSLVLAFAAINDWRTPEEIWRLSRLDEDWQEEQWGPDDEATIQTALRRKAFLHAYRFFQTC